MKKLVVGISLLSLLSGSLMGCSSQSKETIQKTDVKSESLVEQGISKWPVMVIDDLGREVIIEDEPMRVVSSYYITSSLLIALDAKEKVVGIEMKAKERGIYKAAAPEYLKLPALGNSKTFNVEECIKLEPDLVIVPTRLKEYIPQLEAFNIPVIAVEPESMEDFLQTVELIGDAIGRAERAEELTLFHEKVIKEVIESTDTIEEKPSVYFAGSGDPYKTITSKMYQHELIQMAGGLNVSSELIEGYWQTISPETLLTWNPEYIYSVSYAGYPLESVIKDEKLKTVQAVEKKQVKTFPSLLEPWDYPTPSSALGILWLLNELHPELYSEEQLENVTKGFYEHFYNIKLSAEDLGL